MTDAKQLDDRMVELTIESPSVGETRVRLLLPSGFDEDAERTWPVLYLLHGATDDYTAWTERADVAGTTADTDLLVVMPDGGDRGFYSDWWNDGAGGFPAWETYHLTELRGILERDWHAGDKRLIAGASMGGYGAIHYAETHPGLFEAAAAFSGVLDPVGNDDWTADPWMWGDRADQADIWAAHDPVGMVGALAGTTLYLSWGNGQPGPLDPAGAESDFVEAWIAGMDGVFVSRLRELGIPVTIETGPGVHTWPYFDRSLRRALPVMLEALDR